MGIDAVFFDVGNTLIYPDPSVGAVYAGALRDAGIPADAESAEQQFRDAWARLRGRQVPGRLEYGSTEAEAIAWWREVVRESFRPFGEPPDFEAVFGRLWEHFASGEAWRIFDDVPPVLDQLDRSGKGLGIVSNWDVRLEKVLRELGLWSRFRWPVISANVGAGKPAPAIFRYALRQCGLPAERVLHVGDSYEEDVAGARHAGLRAVWLRRGAGEKTDEAINSLTALLDLVD